jgi:hypothetical protein
MVNAVTVLQMPIIEKPTSQYDVEVDKMAFDFAARIAEQRARPQPAAAANAESLRPGDHLGCRRESPPSAADVPH